MMRYCSLIQFAFSYFFDIVSHYARLLWHSFNSMLRISILVSSTISEFGLDGPLIVGKLFSMLSFHL